jgi:hypothetical protein
MISRAAKRKAQSVSPSLTANDFNEAGKHCRGLLLEGSVMAGGGVAATPMSLGVGDGARILACPEAIVVTNHRDINDLIHPTCKMTGIILRSSTRAFQASVRNSASNSFQRHARRMLATAAGSGNAANLPLAGIKVLDMTRVLAGVCEKVLFCSSYTDTDKPYCTQILGDLGYSPVCPRPRSASCRHQLTAIQCRCDQD